MILTVLSVLCFCVLSVGQRIVTKSVDKDDDEGDTDFEDITHIYKDSDGMY